MYRPHQFPYRRSLFNKGACLYYFLLSKKKHKIVREARMSILTSYIEIVLCHVCLKEQHPSNKARRM